MGKRCLQSRPSGPAPKISQPGRAGSIGRRRAPEVRHHTLRLFIRSVRLAEASRESNYSVRCVGNNRRVPQVSLLRPGIRATDPQWKRHPTLCHPEQLTWLRQVEGGMKMGKRCLQSRPRGPAPYQASSAGRRRCGTTLFVCSLGAYPDFLLHSSYQRHLCGSP